MKRTLAVFAAVFVLAGCYAPARHGRVVRSWPASQVNELQVKGLNGRIEVVGDSPSQVTMQADIKYHGRRNVASIVRTELEGATLRVREEHSGSGWRWGIITPSSATVSYVFHVPPSLQGLLATTVNGKILITGVSGRLSTQSVNGAIDIESPSGELTAQTVNGHLRADFQQQFRGAKLKTVNGSIAVTVPPNSQIDCDVHQVNGSFRSDIPMRMNGDAARPGEVPLEATTVNGSITVTERGKGTT